MSDDLDALIAQLRASEERRETLRELLVGELPDLAEALAGLARAQERTEARLETLAERVDALAAAQERTEARLEALAERVDALAAAQERTEVRLEALAERVDALAAAQERTEVRLEALAERVDALAAAQERTEVRLEALTARVDALAESLTARVDALAEHLGGLTATMRDLAEQVKLLASRMDAVTIRADRAHGYLVERRYAEKGHAYFQRIARRLRRLEPPEVDELLASAGVSEDDAEVLRYVDALFSGYLRRQGADGYLVVETSVTIGHEDVTRAHERALILRRAGVEAIGVVAGEAVAEGVGGAARFLGVWQVTNGTVVPPDDGAPTAGAA